MLKHTYGPLAGLSQIQGIWIHPTTPAVLDDMNGRAVLVSVDGRAVYYRAMAPQPEGQGANPPLMRPS